MSTKQCFRCHLWKDEVEFGYRTKHATGLNPVCKGCINSYYKELYASNGERRDYLKQKAAEGADRKRRLVWDYLLEHPCIDCGETDPIVLEFDHRDPSTKLFNISSKVRVYGIDKLQKEIDKCDVRCANCHRRKTAVQFGWHKFLNK